MVSISRKRIYYIAPAALTAVLGIAALAHQSSKAISRQQVEIPVGTRLQLRLNEALDTAGNRAGDHFTATLDSSVQVDNKEVIPAGTQFEGRVTEAKPSGRLEGRGYLVVSLNSFEMNGETYQVDASSHRWYTGSHKKRNWVLIGGGSGLGALVGGLAGGGKGLLIGGPVGIAAGTVGAALTGRKNVYLPAETPITFSLREPLVMRL
jgi:hypothetical protein